MGNLKQNFQGSDEWNRELENKSKNYATYLHQEQIEIESFKFFLQHRVDQGFLSESECAKFDGVLHDTHRDKNIPKFLDCIKPNCKNGTIVSFFALRTLDTRFNSYRHELTEGEIESLPYSKNTSFRYNYELKYTTFNGTEFLKNKNIKGLI